MLALVRIAGVGAVVFGWLTKHYHTADGPLIVASVTFFDVNGACQVRRVSAFTTHTKGIVANGVVVNELRV